MCVSGTCIDNFFCAHCWVLIHAFKQLPATIQDEEKATCFAMLTVAVGWSLCGCSDYKDFLLLCDLLELCI